MQSLSLRLIPVAVLLAFGVSCTAGEPTIVHDVQGLQRVRTIATAPLQLPAGIADPNAVRLAYRRLIDSRLQSAGYRTVDEEQFESRWQRAVEKEEGIYDPSDGRLIPANLQRVQESVFSSLHDEHGADAILYARVVPVLVPFAQGVARGNGARHSLRPFRDVDRVAVGIWGQGRVAALELAVWIWDTDGRPLYWNAAGIEALSKLRAGGGFEPVAPRVLLADPERNQAAVDLVLAPLADAGDPRGKAPTTARAP